MRDQTSAYSYMALIDEFEAAKKIQAAHTLELHPSSSKSFGRFDPVLKITPNSEALYVPKLEQIVPTLEH